VNLKQVNLNDLPKYYPWPERLLGLSPWLIKPRTIEKTEAEYNQDKYLRCLNMLNEKNSQMTMEEMKTYEQAADNSIEICISLEDELFTSTLIEAKQKLFDEIKNTLHPSILKSSTIIELGAGYGYNLWKLSKEFPNTKLNWIAGEYANNAIQIGEKIAGKNINFFKFNFYKTPYNILENTSGLITLFTVYAAQQLPSSKDILIGLRPYKNKIHRVVFFESVYEHYDHNSMLGLMRKRYIDLCDYNTDMLTILKAAEDVEIVSERKNVFGMNPLLPASIIEWKFK